MLNFNDPLIMLLALPAILTLTGHGLFRYFAGDGLGHTLANAALTIAFIITLVFYYGFPGLEFRTTTDQIFIICLISLCFGFLQDRFPKISFLSPQIHIALMIIVIFWVFAGNQNFNIPISRSELFSLAWLTIMGIILFLKLEDIQYNGLQAPISLFWVSIGLFLVSKEASIPLTENIMMIMGASLLTYLVLNFPVPKFPFGASALYPVYLIILCTAINMIQIDGSTSIPLIILIGVFYSENLIELLPGAYATPFIKLFMPAVPIAIAWLIA